MARPVSPNSTGRVATLVLFAFAGTLVLLVSWRVVSRFPTFSLIPGRHVASAGPTTAGTSADPALTGSFGAQKPPSLGIGFGLPPYRASATPSASKSSSPGPTHHRSLQMIVDQNEFRGSTETAMPSSSPTSSTTPSATDPSPTPTPTPSDSSPASTSAALLNAPGSVVKIAGLHFGGAGAATTVTIDGFDVVGPGLVADGGQLDWGDGTGADITPAASALTLSTDSVSTPSFTHTYATGGNYTITWTPDLSATPSSGAAQIWTHQIDVPDAGAAPAPVPTLSQDADGSAQVFDVGESTGCPWALWTLDYGDGLYSTGDNSNRPTDAQRMHTYGQPGSRAVLTVVGPDGQVGTSTVIVN